MKCCSSIHFDRKKILHIKNNDYLNEIISKTGIFSRLSWSAIPAWNGRIANQIILMNLLQTAGSIQYQQPGKIIVILKIFIWHILIELEFCIPGNIKMHRITCTARTWEIRQVVTQIAVKPVINIAAYRGGLVVLEGNTSFLLDEGSLSLFQHMDGSSSLERQTLRQFAVFLHI